MMQDNIITLSLRPDVTVLGVPCPAEWNNIDADLFWENNGMSTIAAKIDLAPGSYELIGLLREFKDAEELAVLNTAIHSAGGDPKQNWLLIKKIA